MTAVRTKSAFRFRGRSFLALVLAPEQPFADWLGDLDAWLERSPGFFTGKPLILDLARVPVTQADFVALIGDLHKRNIHIIGVEGADPSCLRPGLPPLLIGGRSVGEVRPPDSRSAPAKAAVAPPPPVPSLLIDAPVRSGQTVVFPDGDVTVVGSVASGAEIVAAGSIHVYGTLRGRALAGAHGNAKARIFCSQLEAELLAIDGYYQAADDMDAQVRKKPVQVTLVGNSINIGVLE